MSRACVVFPRKTGRSTNWAQIGDKGSQSISTPHTQLPFVWGAIDFSRTHGDSTKHYTHTRARTKGVCFCSSVDLASCSFRKITSNAKTTHAETDDVLLRLSRGAPRAFPSKCASQRATNPTESLGSFGVFLCMVRARLYACGIRFVRVIVREMHSNCQTAVTVFVVVAPPPMEIGCVQWPSVPSK